MASAAAFKTDFLADEERSSRRHSLWLSARVSVRGEAEQVMIHNLSMTGLLFETALALEFGDRIEVELPEAGPTQAEIVWCSDSFFGCEFASPIAAAAVSASRLRSPYLQDAVEMRQASAESVPLAAVVPGGLTPLQKALVIGGAAAACWVPLIVAVAYI
ncbi:PilZ domain-containing protein [Novosphingobium sp. G106]|uniref:PilZ domain-containing protein n=1 Tax=Novosphingobium sp. G106 TaxID=2849500 RepID=UPI001C2D9297|nr:PilZ domain-containing protein [Novosphingobium sp. G106]MBV1687366.1 PilZ domain-containing protein [Novosphingobium sp. G106]